jgi:Chaperone of endosialidase
MKSSMKIKTITLSLLIAFALACFGLLPTPTVFGVVPPPNGGYPGFNTAEGQNALKNLTTGSGNTGIGWYSLFSATTASFNTGLGAGALALNTADENTAIGAAALLVNNASGNTAVGSRALLNNTTGGTLGNIQGFDFGPNVAVGSEALQSNTIGSANIGIGYQALQSFTTGPVGFEQLGLCTAVGFQTLAHANGAFANSAFGYQALVDNTDGNGNTAVGVQALSSNTTGNSNTANGTFALSSNTEGDYNTADGSGALSGNTTGSSNTAVGAGALIGNTTGNLNTAIGVNALTNNTSGGVNMALGVAAGSGITTANNVIAIGTAAENVDDSCYIGHIFGATSGGTAVLINASGRLGTTTSSRRFKEDIKPMDEASEALLELKPVTFHYKKDIDPEGRSQFGLVAEEVEKVNPDLVVHDKDGKPYTVRYDQVNAMLLNEFLKEHKKVQEQQAAIRGLKSAAAKQELTISELKKDMGVLTAQFKEQAAQIQKVSVQVETTRPAPRLVTNR